MKHKHVADEVERCPFCGSEDGPWAGATRVWWVQCEGCGAAGPSFKTKWQAVEAWNAVAILAMPAVESVKTAGLLRLTKLRAEGVL